MKKFTLLCACIIYLMMACDKKTAKPTPPIVVSKCDTISFAKHIKPIVDVKCIGCHNETFTGANYKLYQDLKEKALNGKLKGYVIDGVPKIMPLGESQLPQAQLDLILCWINNGAKP